MPFNKFDPHAEVEDDALAASTPEAARRAKVLKWGQWVTLGMLLLGYGIIAWKLFE